jgi:hypothetical protein
MRKIKIKKSHPALRPQTDEEYATELIPALHSHIKEKERYSNRRVGLTIGYTALFLSLFSLVMLPFILGALSIVLGIITWSFHQRTLAYTAIGFGFFSVIFSLMYNM